jgi:DNA-binding transcriptional regulator YdaS (Cro superfamily)
MTPETIRRVGEALCGPQWQGALAERLAVSQMTLHNGRTGRRTPRSDRRAQIKQAIRDQITLLRELQRSI